MRSTSYVGILAVLLLAGACTQQALPPAPPKPDLEAAEQAIRAQDAAWMKAAQARDAAGEVAILASDAIIVRQNQPAMDPAAFQVSEVKFFADNPKVMSNWTTDTLQINDSGEWAVQTGTYTLTGLGPKGDVTDSGKFTTRWKKVGSTWKVVQDLSVSTTPLPIKQ